MAKIYSPNLTEINLDGPLSELLKDSHSMLNSGCHGNQKEKLKKIYFFVKKLLAIKYKFDPLKVWQLECGASFSSVYIGKT